MQLDQELHRDYSKLTEDFSAFGIKDQLVEIDAELTTLKSQTVAEDFWNDQSKATEVNSKISHLEKSKSELTEAHKRLQDMEFMYTELKSGEEAYIDDFRRTITELQELYEKLKIRRYLNGKFDDNSAIFSIFAGQGGTEANDWAEMLMRMYMRYFNTKGWEVEIIDKTPGTETGISSTTLKVTGSFAYGYLKSEHGTHRLVRVSPFNAQGLRQTSFAGVEVSPIVRGSAEYDIKPEDIDFSAVRSGGAGGQNVNKVATSVRLHHIPSGIIVTCSTQRSQLQNKETAMDMLRGKLALMEQERLMKEISAASGDKFQASWGSQIRNYVLNPYKLVKDLRTGEETDQVDSVLDGSLDRFVNSAIAWMSEQGRNR